MKHVSQATKKKKTNWQKVVTWVTLVTMVTATIAASF